WIKIVIVYIVALILAAAGCAGVWWAAFVAFARLAPGLQVGFPPRGRVVLWVHRDVVHGVFLRWRAVGRCLAFVFLPGIGQSEQCMCRCAGVIFRAVHAWRVVPMGYTTQGIRNIAFAGSAGAGKTLLLEALLLQAGAIRSKGNLQRGGTV